MANSSTSGGVSLVGMTFLVFLTLKLCSVIDWSWWWVTAPLWGGLAIWLSVLVTILLFSLVMLIFACILGAFAKFLGH